MIIKRKGYIKNTLLPCLFFSAITGTLTGALIFAFKTCASYVISFSEHMYSVVRNQPIYIPAMLATLAAIAAVAAVLLKYESSCKGGGIPTSIAILRGLITFSWLKNVIILFASAMLTYFGGVPLGNEGPSVQMGTAVGRGTVRIFGKKREAWDRYVMTGGACAGFAAATGAPISGMLFSLEEAHRRFSPMIFMTSAIAVIAGSLTMEGLCYICGTSSTLFHFSIDAVLPMRFIWLALITGALCALVAVIFTKLYSRIFVFFATKLSRVPLVVKFIVIFVIVGLVGLAGAEFIGSGHDVIEIVLRGRGLQYLIIIVLCVRALLLLVANNAGVTGGLFVPMLAFGALIGSFCAGTMTSLGVLSEEYYAIIVLVGISSFLSASSRTPLTAIVFAVEALSGLENVLPIAAGAVFAYFIIEMLGVPAFSEVVIGTKVESERAGKSATVVKKYITVRDGSFIVGKEIRDILWPPTCVVTSIKKAEGASGHCSAVGDVLHVHYVTYDNEETIRLLEAIVGDQDPDDDVDTVYREKTDKDHIPDN